MVDRRFTRLPEIVEFADYNSKITMYYFTQEEIADLMKENRKRMKEIDELKKKYFDGHLLKKETIALMKQRGITSFYGISLREE